MTSEHARPLGFAETAFAALHEATGSHVIRLAVYLTGVVNAATVAEAMEQIVARHPMLRAQLVAGRRGYRLVSSAHAEPAFDVLYARDDHSVDSVIAQRETLTFPPGGPLYRVVFILDVEHARAAFVWFSHHAISDGISIDMLTAESCALIDEIASGRKVESVRREELPEPLEMRVGGPRRPLGFVRTIVRDARDRIGAVRPPYAERPAVASRRSRHLFMVFSPEQTARLKCDARQAEVGVSELFSAAMLKATVADHCPGRKSARVPLFVPTDCRGSMPGGARPNRKVLAMGTHMTCLYPAVHLDEPVGQLARALRDRMQSPAFADPREELVGRFPAWFVRAELFRRATRSSGFQHGIAFTHAGRHKIPSDAAVFADARFGNMTVRDGCLLVSGISFLNADCLILALSYTEPLLSDYAAKRLANAIAATLGMPDAVTMTRSFDAVFAEVKAKGRFPAYARSEGDALPGPMALSA